MNGSAGEDVSSVGSFVGMFCNVAVSSRVGKRSCWIGLRRCATSGGSIITVGGPVLFEVFAARSAIGMCSIALSR